MSGDPKCPISSDLGEGQMAMKNLDVTGQCPVPPSPVMGHSKFGVGDIKISNVP